MNQDGQSVNGSVFFAIPNLALGSRHHGPGIDGAHPRLPLERPTLEAGVTMRVSTQKGFSLIEVLFALGILTTGILAAAAVMAAGVEN